MIFLVYSDINSSTIQNSLGMPEYSYYFVLKTYAEVLRNLGKVVFLNDPATEADELFDAAQERGEECVFLCFSPPHRAPIGLRCPTLCVFAWEFSNLPYETWDDDPRNDWRLVLARHGRTITLSSYTEQVVRQVMGENFPVRAIPVPVCNENEPRAAAFNPRDPPLSPRALEVCCTVIDSRYYEITTETFINRSPPEYFKGCEWPGEPTILDFSLRAGTTGFIGGFYDPESWGTWSRIADPWIMLPFRLAGRYSLGIEATAYGPNVGHTIQIGVGDQFYPLTLTNDFARSDFIFNFQSNVNLIQLTGLNTSSIPNAADPRTMGLGLRRIWLESDEPATPVPGLESAAKQPIRIPLDGVVYTGVFNPGDDRKNWLDMLSGFCFAFRDEPRAILLMKMTHHSVGSFLGQFHYMLQRIGPVKCRIVILHGYLDDELYRQLIDVSTYCVNTSHGEGLCLPLMEFMSDGIPALSPCHTAMKDYVDSNNAFVIDSSVEPAIWPQDPRALLRTLRYRIDWRSLVKAFQDSFRTALDNPADYRSMSRHAHAAQFDFCSHAAVTRKLDDFFNRPAAGDQGRRPSR